MRQNALSPRRLRQLPLILAWSLAILIACSQVLFVQSTPKSAVKYRTWSIRSAMRLASLEASLLRPLTPGALAAAPCSAVLAYRPRIWPRVAGGRLDAPASVAASTARRALLGLSIFTLVGGLATANMSAIKDWFAGRAMTGTARFLIAVAALFALLWLSEIGAGQSEHVERAAGRASAVLVRHRSRRGPRCPLARRLSALECRHPVALPRRRQRWRSIASPPPRRP